jgi:hypothetical protein
VTLLAGKLARVPRHFADVITRKSYDVLHGRHGLPRFRRQSCLPRFRQRIEKLKERIERQIVSFEGDVWHPR